MGALYSHWVKFSHYYHLCILCPGVQRDLRHCQTSSKAREIAQVSSRLVSGHILYSYSSHLPNTLNNSARMPGATVKNVACKNCHLLHVLCVLQQIYGGGGGVRKLDVFNILAASVPGSPHQLHLQLGYMCNHTAYCTHYNLFSSCRIVTVVFCTCIASFF